MTLITKEKENTTGQHLYLVCFVSTLEAHFSEILVHVFLKRAKALFIFVSVCLYGCVSQTVFLPSFQNSSNLESFL